MPSLLDFRRVSVMRGPNLALRDIDLQIEIGEHVALLGPNGSGKTTLIKTITRECYPLRAPGSSLSIMGRERWDVFELRRMLGIVTPDLLTQCPEWVTGMEAVLSGFSSSMGIWRGRQRVTAEMEASAMKALERLEATVLADRLVNELSSGELRRIQLARALAHQPAALLLDEPSSHLDLSAQAELRRLLGGLARSGVGLVLVTHHLADIVPEVDRVILIGNGRIVADGPKQVMLEPGRLAALFRVPVEVTERDGYYHAW